MTTTTLEPPLTVEVVRDLLNAAVAEKGENYVDPRAKLGGCLYVRYDETPGCIIGNILHRAGVPLDVLSTFEGSAVIDLVGPKGLCLAADNIVRQALQQAQETQDEGKTWGEALAAYDAFVKNPAIYDTGV